MKILYVNEIAPRVHNSGHLTINAYNVSQFENHVRAVCSLKQIPIKKIIQCKNDQLNRQSNRTLQTRSQLKDNEFFFDYLKKRN